MRKSDATALLGALLGGGTGLRPARRRRRAPAGLIGIPMGGTGRGSGGTALARAAIGVLGGIAVEVIRGMNQRSTQQPAPASAPAPARGLPDVKGAPWSPPPAPAAGEPPPEPEPETDAEADEAMLLVRAMIAAARADGQIDQAERRAIAERLDSAGLDAAERDLVLAEFQNPMPIEVLAAQVADPVAAAQVYAASVIAVGEASPAERVYLEQLAAKLRLTPEAAAAIQARLR
jgi:uncharacterized membrane protein YebE (DUF533 family)